MVKILRIFTSNVIIVIAVKVISDTIFSGSHQPLHHWITVLYLMNLNSSTLQITQELEISEDTARRMCTAIREGIVKKA